YKAVANNGAGLSASLAASGPLSISLWPNPPPTPSAQAGAAVSLAWSVPLGDVLVSGYDIYRSTTAGVPQTIIGQVTTTPTPASTAVFVDSQVTPGIAYYYWVDSQGGNGLTSSLPSSPVSIIPLLPPTLQITPGPSRNTLNWSPVSLPVPNNVTGYVVYRAILVPFQTPVFNPIGSIVEGLSNTASVDTTVSDTVIYVYKVAATSLNGVLSSFSNSVAVTQLPSPVTNLVAVSGDGLVQLRWINQGTPNNTYTLLRKLGTAPSSAFQIIKTGVTGVNYQDMGVQDKTFYVYQMITVDSLGLTSTAAAVTALPAKPPVVTNGAVTLSQDQNGNTLSWTAAQPLGPSDSQNMYPLGGYHIYRSTSGGPPFTGDGVHQWIGTVG
ncbi:MAG TPA: hypothetical protein VIJ93_05140, partial [bacterium]